jgi:hypothetical protein
MKNESAKPTRPHGTEITDWLDPMELIAPPGSNVIIADIIDYGVELPDGTTARSGDMLIIDLSAAPRPGDAVMVVAEGVVTVRVYEPPRRLRLVTDEEEQENDGEVYGVATLLLRRVRDGERGAR